MNDQELITEAREAQAAMKALGLASHPSEAAALAFRLADALEAANRREANANQIIEDCLTSEKHWRETNAALEAVIAKARAALCRPLDTLKVLDTPPGRALWKAVLADDAKAVLEQVVPNAALDVVIADAKAEQREVDAQIAASSVNGDSREYDLACREIAEWLRKGGE